MIGWALILKKIEGQLPKYQEPLIVAQAKSGKWIAVDEDAGTYCLLTSDEIEHHYEVIEQFGESEADLIKDSEMALRAILAEENDGMTLEEYIANN